MVLSGRLISLLAVLAVTPPGSVARAADDGDGLAAPTLRIPGLPPITMPPGGHLFDSDDRAPGARAPEVATPNADIYHEYGTVSPGGGRRDRALGDRGYGGRSPGTDPYGGTVIGPGGVLKRSDDADRRTPAPPKKKPPTLEEKQAQIRRALAPKPPLAVARRRTLDDLYIKLAQAKDEDESKGLASLISAIWMRSGSDTADLLMARAEKAVGDKKYPLAVEVLDRVIALQPNWAEAWNKRASARYLDGDLNGAMADVDHVLKLEPNHFSALGGMAMILQRTGFDKRALQVYRRDLAVYPHQPEVEKIVEKLTLEVEGQGI